jgi:hypothetical protein
MSTPLDDQPFEEPQASEPLTPESPSAKLLPESCGGDRCPDDLSDYIRDSVLQNLPNDLTRMIYLASLRDCNSGIYLHPELSRQRGLLAADRAFRVCHERLFRRLLTTRLAEYVRQLQEYIRYSGGETLTTLKTWKSLQAYRATVPLGALAASSEIFFLNLSIALEILSKQVSALHSA